MRTTLITFISFGLLIFTSFTLTENNDNQTPNFVCFVQFNIDKDISLEEASSIDSLISTKKGILASRTDFVNDVFFCYTESDAKISEENFILWFKDLDVPVSCFNKGIEGKDVQKSISELKNCKNEN